MSTLASLLEGQGKDEEAEQLNSRALEGMKELLGPKHPVMLTVMGNLTSTL